MSEYIAILIMLVVSIGMAIVPVLAGWILGPKKPSREKSLPYECGFDAFGDARVPFDVRFYLVAILFIIFDLETAFLFPWAVALKHIGWWGLASMSVFLAVLVMGFVYEWGKGALEWE